MLVHLRGPAGHLDVQDALASELDLRGPLVEMVTAFDRRAVRMQDLLVRADERSEVRAPDFLLALDDELQVDRRPTLDALPCLDREELHDEIALRVRAASTPELAVLDRRVERIPRPLVQRVDRLDIVTLIHEERRLALGDDHLTEDDVRPAVRRIFAGLETVLDEQTTDERRGLGLGPLVGRNHGEPDVLLPNIVRRARIRLDPALDIPEGQTLNR